MNESEKINIVFTIDNHYLKFFTVAATSLVEHNSKIIDKIYVIYTNIQIKKLTKVVTYFDKKYQIKIIPILIEMNHFENLNVHENYSLAVYYRLLLPDLLPKTIDKILFLDSDIIVTSPLNNIVSYSFEGIDKEKLYVYAVDHSFTNEEINDIRRIGLKSNIYYNAGVLWINLKYWRSTNFSTKAMTFALENKFKLKWNDQDVLNILTDGQFGLLDKRFNVIDRYTESVDEPIIIHYNTFIKPWHFLSTHKYKSQYWKYLRKTPFYLSIPQGITLSNILRKYVPVFLKKYISNFTKFHKKYFL